MAEGQARRGFDLDLRYGQEAENQLAEILDGNKIEVKRDARCMETGNLYVEYAYKGQPSGIKTTEAEWWAFQYRKDRFILIKTEDLKGYVKRAIKEGLVKPGGDYNKSEGATVPIKWIVKE